MGRAAIPDKERKQWGNDCPHKEYTASSDDDYLEVPKNKSVTVDLKGFTLNRNRTSDDSDGHVFWVKECGLRRPSAPLGPLLLRLCMFATLCS